MEELDFVKDLRPELDGKRISWEDLLAAAMCDEQPSAPEVRLQDVRARYHSPDGRAFEGGRMSAIVFVVRMFEGPTPVAEIAFLGGPILRVAATLLYSADAAGNMVPRFVRGTVRMTSSRALVCEQDGTRRIIEILPDGTVNGPNEVPPGLHLNMWFQADGKERCFVLETPAPYPDVVEWLQADTALRRMFSLFRAATDRVTTDDLRRRCAQYLDEMITSNPSTAEALKDALRAHMSESDEARPDPSFLLPLGASLYDEVLATERSRPS